ncbi:MAG: KOW domain-containing RNA-binding protein [Oscillospiraceae bacterium]|nr:KOW domain-containing RNA-binding protein [Oscillospiraceae bacterium]
MEVRVGTVVKSGAGRDKGLFMVVTAVEGDFAYIADGKLRKLDSPKKKRIKHLKVTNTFLDTVNLTNKALRTFIARL